MTRVLIFGTHPHQYNGYSKVLYELACRAASSDSVEIGLFGFQNYSPAELPSDVLSHRDSRSIPANVFIHDAWAHEDPKSVGFGLDQIKGVVESFKPDVCVIYNDMLVIRLVSAALKRLETRDSFRVVGYIDQVYKWPKHSLMTAMNENLDEAIVFTEGWEKAIKSQGLTIPVHVLNHGYDPSKTFPVPRSVARRYFGLSDDDLILLNLNRNQPRKRWDTCLKMMAELVMVFPDEPIKLVIATALTGAWDLLDVYHKELSKRGVPVDKGMRHIIVIDRPQRLTDREINILMNASDIGINTCDGEGFGLCNFEHAICGKPQIVPRIGGFVDYLDDNNTIFVEPMMAIYNTSENNKDGTGGEMCLSLYSDFVSAVETYAQNRKLMEAHGESVRNSILSKPYTWDEVGDRFINILNKIVGAKPKPEPEPESEHAPAPESGSESEPKEPVAAPSSKAGKKGGRKPRKSKQVYSGTGNDDAQKHSVNEDAIASKKRQKRAGGGYKRSTDDDLRMEINELKDAIAQLMKK